MILGITGTDGAGKGETVWGTVARGCLQFLEYANKNSGNLNSVCKTPVPQRSQCGFLTRKMS